MKFAGLVLNQRGMERFLSSGLDVATVAVSCTESHSRANCKMSIEDAIKTTSRIIADGRRESIEMRAYASMAFGCPFEDVVEPVVVNTVVHMRLLKLVRMLLSLQTHSVWVNQRK